MPSLTSFLPEMAPVFRLTNQALYERVRALVRMKMLPTPVGRGRGAGADANPETVARLIVAVMATDNLSEIDERVHRLALAPYVNKKQNRCPWTGATTFVDALAYLLSLDAPEEGGHAAVRVFRDEPRALISFAWQRRPFEGVSEFGRRQRPEAPRMGRESELPYAAIKHIREQLLWGEKWREASEQSK